MSSENEVRIGKYTIRQLTVRVLIVVTLAWMAIGFSPLILVNSKSLLRVFFLSDNDLSRSGTFGDTFGFANSLFSSLAFAGVLLAIVFQQVQFRDQRKQIELAEKHLEHARGESQKEAEARQKMERDSLLSASLNAASSIAQAYANLAELKPEMSELATFQFNKYRQLQEIILFDIQNPPSVGSVASPILSLETKRGFYNRSVRNLEGQWTDVERKFRDSASEPPERDRHIEEAKQVMILLDSITLSFRWQEGVDGSEYAGAIDITLRDLGEFLRRDEFPRDQLKAKIALFDRGRQILASAILR